MPLSTDTVIELQNVTTGCKTLTVEEIIAEIMKTPQVVRYQNQLGDVLAPSTAWAEDQTITISITVNATATP